MFWVAFLYDNILTNIPFLSFFVCVLLMVLWENFCALFFWRVFRYCRRCFRQLFIEKKSWRIVQYSLFLGTSFGLCTVFHRKHYDTAFFLASFYCFLGNFFLQYFSDDASILSFLSSNVFNGFLGSFFVRHFLTSISILFLFFSR